MTNELKDVWIIRWWATKGIIKASGYKHNERFVGIPAFKYQQFFPSSEVFFSELEAQAAVAKKAKMAQSQAERKAKRASEDAAAADRGEFRVVSLEQVNMGTAHGHP